MVEKTISFQSAYFDDRFKNFDFKISKFFVDSQKSVAWTCNRDFGDFKLVTVLKFWWQNFDVGDVSHTLVPSTNVKRCEMRIKVQWWMKLWHLKLCRILRIWGMLKSDKVSSATVFYNPHIPNIDAISGALFILRIQYEYTQTQCDEGAKDGIDILYMGIIRCITAHWNFLVDHLSKISSPRRLTPKFLIYSDEKLVGCPSFSEMFVTE